MQSFPKTIVIRHRLENLNKCSLRGLESRSDFEFITYPYAHYAHLPQLSNYIILMMNAPPLSVDDANYGILLLDATWRYAEKMSKPFIQHANQYQFRSLPNHYRTAYPRRQQDCPNPEEGLASIEAIFLTYKILGRSTEGLLDHYYWKENFLKINKI